MIGWLNNLNPAQRKAVIDTAERQRGIQAKAIEKDWWVTLTLKALFQSKYRDQIFFKGGTSLSKGWDLINRFSEDIDIVLDPAVYGQKHLENPSNGQLNKMRKDGNKFTNNELLNELNNQFAALGVPANTLNVVATHHPQGRHDSDPQEILVKYSSLYPQNDYLRDEVKIEVGFRSSAVPYTKRNIQSILNQYNPQAVYGETPFEVQIVEPKKTFLEKIFLLHEEFGKPDKAGTRIKRMSRHLYDLHRLMQTDHGTLALKDHELYDGLVHHRRTYIQNANVDYDTLHHLFVTFIPPVELLEAYNSDFDDMNENMTYGDNSSFEIIISDLKKLQAWVRLKQEHKTFDEIVGIAKEKIMNDDFFNGKRNEGATLTTVVSFFSDPYFPASAANKSVNYEVTFLFKANQLHFEKIRIS